MDSKSITRAAHDTSQGLLSTCVWDTQGPSASTVPGPTLKHSYTPNRQPRPALSVCFSVLYSVWHCSHSGRWHCNSFLCCAKLSQSPFTRSSSADATHSDLPSYIISSLDLFSSLFLLWFFSFIVYSVLLQFKFLQTAASSCQNAMNYSLPFYFWGTTASPLTAQRHNRAEPKLVFVASRCEHGGTPPPRSPLYLQACLCWPVVGRSLARGQGRVSSEAHQRWRLPAAAAAAAEADSSGTRAWLPTSPLPLLSSCGATPPCTLSLFFFGLFFIYFCLSLSLSFVCFLFVCSSLLPRSQNFQYVCLFPYFSYPNLFFSHFLSISRSLL